MIYYYELVMLLHHDSGSQHDAFIFFHLFHDTRLTRTYIVYSTMMYEDWTDKATTSCE